VAVEGNVKWTIKIQSPTMVWNSALKCWSRVRGDFEFEPSSEGGLFESIWVILLSMIMIEACCLEKVVVIDGGRDVPRLVALGGERELNR